ncbi:hypothetical protein T11_1230 [Trichinella zimbabwensis]|uniref:Uncharacterized protein n=1 Tax=Trichinella zimbabwensis TaxID=268475 RepID=A0A0V1GPR3_9BILA|nr:hypothetical protein T11_15636 [Trichinella zimbabwensis]KRZ00350.1 hypothetical protein T11_1230 [Trichinella zimbabwensis]
MKTKKTTLHQGCASARPFKQITVCSAKLSDVFGLNSVIMISVGKCLINEANEVIKETTRKPILEFKFFQFESRKVSTKCNDNC